MESQSYILAAAQAGAHNEKRRSYGHALAVDPWGVVVGDAGDAAPSLVTVDLDLDKVRSIREKMPIQAHRRRDVVELRARTMDKLFARNPLLLPHLLEVVHGPLGPGGRGVAAAPSRLPLRRRRRRVLCGIDTVAKRSHEDAIAATTSSQVHFHASGPSGPFTVIKARPSQAVVKRAPTTRSTPGNDEASAVA